MSNVIKFKQPTINPNKSHLCYPLPKASGNMEELKTSEAICAQIAANRKKGLRFDNNGNLTTLAKGISNGRKR